MQYINHWPDVTSLALPKTVYSLQMRDSPVKV